MDFFIWFLFLVLGVALGSGTAAYFLRSRDKQETEHAKNGYEAQVESLNNQLRDLRTKMDSARDESKRYWDELQTEKKYRKEADEKVTVIPGLKSDVETKDKNIRELRQENADLKESLDAIEKELNDERQSFKECLIFVQGSHYLPAGVVRDMMRQQGNSPKEKK
ncbi:MAG: hypothetical protein KQH63_05620 [Desulfobulbaceae bacterium]|nr:hypothetical protein [Desulfobulbaceae bacterium]